jgi:hypothetical protein
MLEVIAGIAIVGYVIGRQLLGEPLRGKRLIMLPAVLTVLGVVDLAGHGQHPGSLDIALIAAAAIIAAAIGVRQGLAMHLQARDGVLWGQMPPRSLWLWLALVLSHGLLDLIAVGLGAHVAASSTPILLTLGVNRLAQAMIIAPRALSAGIPFAPEKDGSTFLAGAYAAARQPARESSVGGER